MDKERYELGADVILKNNEEFLINSSHELKTPLNVIHGSIQLIELYMKSNSQNNMDKISSNVESIKVNTFRLMKTINNILDLKKIESGLFNLYYSYVNIVELVEDVVFNVSEEMRSKGFSFVFDTNLEEKNLMVDKESISRVMLNMLSNAVKYSNPEGKIFINVTVKDNYVEIAVIDKGIGIDKQYLDNIFTKFGQVDKSLSRRAEGSGLGLKLSKAIIEAHGGNITVYSKPNKGSIFTINLPCKKNDNVCTLYTKKVINYDSLKEMIKIEFSDIVNMGA